LQRCHESSPLFQQVLPVTLRASLQALKFRFWDEQSKELVGYAHVRRLETNMRAS
jgi:omega-6 fatty acid desaturase (delta-12 desaturase)